MITGASIPSPTFFHNEGSARSLSPNMCAWWALVDMFLDGQLNESFDKRSFL